ncbi:transglycosylase SLT domain-containing protein [Yokenella regensburgei]|uniref:transglycosylase SLT domain-containing protein n=1 Tax=Yokenella regensburgei TaxID=158877 RepID=UPI003EDAB3FC
MIIQELAYKVTIKADEFLNGKKKVQDGANELANNVKRPLNSVEKQFDGLTDSVKGFGAAGKNAFHDVQLGAAKFLGIALTLEGARRMLVSTTGDLVRLGNASSFLDMNPRTIDGWVRMAKAVGASEQSITSSLMNMRNSMDWNAFKMGAPDASTLAMMQAQGMTGVDILNAKSPGEGILQQAKAIQKMSEPVARRFWGAMGNSQELFPAAFSGDMAKLQKQFESQSDVTQKSIDSAKRVQEAIEKLDQAVDNVGRRFVEVFGEDIISGLNKLSDWVTNNKGDILGFFSEMTTAAKQLTDAFGGIGNLLKVYAGYRLGGMYGAAVAAGYVIGDATTPEEQKNLPNKDRNWLYRKRSFGEILNDTKDSLIAPYAPPGGFTPSKNESESFYDKLLSALGFGSAHAGSMQPNLIYPAPSGPMKGTNDKLLDAIMMTESSGNPLAYNSKSGATGAYQFMRGTAIDLGLRVDNQIDERLDPEKSRAAASIYMSRLVSRYNGNLGDALMAYNWGMGNVDQWIKQGRGDGYTDKNGKWRSLPQETKDYTGKVFGNLKQMTQLASIPANAGYGQVDNSQSSNVNINTVNVTSNPESVDALSESIMQQANRSRMNISFSSGVS